MKRVKYSKYIPNLAEEVSLEDLMDALSDFLLESGFEDELGDTTARAMATMNWTRCVRRSARRC